MSTYDEQRGKRLRGARTRALARLRAEHDERFQQLLDEEIANAGLEPRAEKRAYSPRGKWGKR